MPGRSECVLVEVGHIGPDKNGVPCVFFEVDGVIGAEAIADLLASRTDRGYIWSVRGEDCDGVVSVLSSRQKLARAKQERM
jgi:hypothetical protein